MNLNAQGSMPHDMSSHHSVSLHHHQHQQQKAAGQGDGACFDSLNELAPGLSNRLVRVASKTNQSSHHGGGGGAFSLFYEDLVPRSRSRTGMASLRGGEGGSFSHGGEDGGRSHQGPAAGNGGPSGPKRGARVAPLHQD